MEELRAPMPPALLTVLQQRFGNGGVGLPNLADLAGPHTGGMFHVCVCVWCV